ncbi:MAG: AAA family ATPase [Sutterella wadsworthensis]|nr:AAA family ATPase [Sutterella wadsworthensis]
MQDFQSLPIGTHSFPALRSENQIYVDKTDRIFELACQRNKLFLARPKGFGSLCWFRSSSHS